MKSRVFKNAIFLRNYYFLEKLLFKKKKYDYLVRVLDIFKGLVWKRDCSAALTEKETKVLPVRTGRILF